MTCSRNTGVDCDPQKKPLAVSTCFTQDCPQVVDNFGGIDWSGSGWSSKEVLNEINSIPEVKPPPKHSTTRAQPRNPNNLNNNVEGDFHYHNNIENIDPEKGVEVDDFYYDYNFINFHEDLSDDFENDGKDSGDGHRLNTPQEAKPTRSVKENVYMESTRAPTATPPISTISKATAYTLKTEETVIKNQDNVKDNGATKESENLDDFLSEDYLLPVSTTRSPAASTPQHSQTLKETHESISTAPSVVFTTQESTGGVKGKEAENDNVTEEETHTEDVTVTPTHLATINTVATTVSAQETEERDDYEYSYNEKTTPAPDQDDVESPEALDSPTPETTIQVKTEVQPDESASEIPQTSSQSTVFPPAFTSEDLDLDQTNFKTVYATSQYSWDSDLDLSTTSLPASEEPTPLPAPSLIISGNQEASDDSTSSTGTEIIPPTNLEGTSQPSPDDSPPAIVKLIPTEAAFTETTGTDSTSTAPSIDFADFDYNEIVIPPMVRSSSKPSHQLPTNTATTPQHSTTPAQHTDLPTPAVLVLPTHPPILRPLPVPTPVQTSASTQVATAAHWVTGNWSAVSLHQPHILVLYLNCEMKHSCCFCHRLHLLCRQFSFAPCTHLTEFFDLELIADVHLHNASPRTPAVLYITF